VADTHAKDGTGIGAAVRRVEDARLLTGRGEFTDDFNLPGQAYAAVVRAAPAHARLRSVETAEAAAMPGVLAVLTAAELRADGVRPLVAQGNPKDVELKNRDGSPVYYPGIDLLAVETVRRAGEAVALVVAETAEQAQDAAERVAVTCDPLPAVVEPHAALAPGAPRLWERAASNLCVDDRKGDAGSARQPEPSSGSGRPRLPGR
jgi:carbon-monoxide dehydrogenase large subunit